MITARPTRALLALVTATALLTASPVAGVGGGEAVAAGKRENRHECKEKRKGSREWRKHHCARFR